jgi:hypothetical protein
VAKKIRANPLFAEHAEAAERVIEMAKAMRDDVHQEFGAA